VPSLLPSELADLAERATNEGWATGQADLGRLRYAAQRLDWAIVELRSGDGGSTALRPTPTELAHPRSHSAKVGTGEQPLHTDGAHLRYPPRWLILYSEEPNLTPSLFFRLRPRLVMTRLAVSLPQRATDGLFLVDSGSDRFLALLQTSGGGWRWDPGCMTPCDQRAREAADFLGSLSGAAQAYEWAEPNQFLLLDNTQMLHARGDASEDDQRCLTRLAYSPRVPS
jgi:hypothetical protein